jgi:hypothetical protein
VKGSSFCEQKEAKKLQPFRAAGASPLGVARPAADRYIHGAMSKVFLLLFVHKKKTLPSFGAV